MARKETDYSTTIIYKITCTDPVVKDIYVGHTTNFSQRRQSHKQNSTKNKCKLYKTIRDNGGWNNWTMEIIDFYNCKNLYEAKIKEQAHFLELNANLNSIEPLPQPHIRQKKPLDSTMYLNQNINVMNTEYECVKCNFKCKKQSNYNTHLQTKSHKNDNIVLKTHECKNCGKIYKHSSTLSTHKKTCTSNKKIDINNNNKRNGLIELLIKENTEFKDILLEVMKNNSNLQKELNEIQKQLNEIQKQQNEIQQTLINLLNNN